MQQPPGHPERPVAKAPPFSLNAAVQTLEQPPQPNDGRSEGAETLRDMESGHVIGSSPSEGPGQVSESEFSEDSVSDWHTSPQTATPQTGSSTHIAPQPAASSSSGTHTAPRPNGSVATATAAAAAAVVRAARPRFACQGPVCRNCGRTRNTTPYNQSNTMITNITCPVCGGLDCGNAICPCFGRTIVVQYGNANRSSRRQSPRDGHNGGPRFPTMEH